MSHCTAPIVASPPRRLNAVALRGQLRLPVTLHAKRPSDRVRAVIWRFPGLTPKARLLALLLSEYVGDSFRAWPKQATLAAVLEMPVRRVRDRIRECEDAGLIVSYRKSRYAVYTFPAAALGPHLADVDRTPVTGRDRTPVTGRDRTVVTDHIRTVQRDPVQREPVPEPPVPAYVHNGERAEKLIERWRSDWYPRYRPGVNVLNADREMADLEAALRLCEQFEDDELETMCVFFLRIPDGAEEQFQRRKTRTLRWCLGCAGALSRKLKLTGRTA